MVSNGLSGTNDKVGDVVLKHVRFSSSASFSFSFERARSSTSRADLRLRLLWGFCIEQFKNEKFQKEYKSYIEGFGTVLAKYEELIVARKQFAPFLKVRSRSFALFFPS